MPDNNQMQGAPTTTSDVGNQLPDPDQQSPSLFAQYMANAANSNQQPTQTQPPPISQNPITGGPQVNPGNGQPPKPLYADSSEKTSTDPRDLHPSVQSASIVRRVAETLAGGPRLVTTIDPETGERKQTPVPLSSRQILLGAVANILGSSGQLASNLSNRMQGRAPQPIKPLPTQQAQQQQAAQAESDFDRIQLQKIRAAKVLTSNMEAHRVAWALAHEEEITKQAEVAAHADSLANFEKAGTVSASGLSADDIMGKGSRFSKTDYFFIPDGVVPLYRNGERVMTNGIPASTFTYSAIKGSEQAPLSQDSYDKFVKYGVMKSSKPLSDQGDTFRVSQGATVSGPTLALMNYKIGLISQLQRELDSVHDATGAPKVDLASEIRNDPRLLSSVEQWHNDYGGNVDDPAQQLASLKASKNPKAQAAADNIAALFGPANLSKYMQLQQDKQAAHAADLAADAAGKKKAAEGKAEEPFKEAASDRTEQRQQNAEDRKQAQKDRSTMGYVEDLGGKTFYVSKYDAQNNPQYSAQSFSEVKPSDLSKDRQIIRPLSDVQMNLNHYRTATNSYDAAVQNGRINQNQVSSDRDNLTTIFSAPDITNAAAAHAGAEGFGISVPTLSADLNAGLAKKVTTAYNALSPEGKQMADNYVRARAAIPAWVKALTNSGRGSKEQLDIELQNLLPPYYKTGDIHNRLDGFQDNLENQKTSLPQNLLGRAIPSPVTRGAQPQANPQTVQSPPQFQKYSSDGKWGWNGSAWVSTGR